ncbi:alpha/beta-hydrolase [Annulohypoxylon maeteangense]|uniref:alpha/beta-hydrolase n=1 Tax=Annulohypoxylon maeteangense TaxID=1927788 RepID=UPI0020077E3F|nr:alpha/beta-hydrolase [Annulohypoxylon maeteangense]KAI0888958.1 alpha/beta-hydrolase [Annulohypoxylon maeteangense]
MASQKPVIVIIHGAFFSPMHYRRLIDPLRAQGYVVISPPMTTTGLDDTVGGKTYVDDVNRILEYLTPYLDEGREAVVLGHSQGGIAASALTENQTVEDRKAKGLKGGIKAVIYLTALAIPTKGATLMGILGGTPPPIYKAEGPFYVLTELALSPQAGDLRIPEEDRIGLSKSLVHQSKASLEAPVQYTAVDVTVPKTYIVCSEDPSLPAALQETMAETAGCKIVKIAAGHFPFLESVEKAKEVVDIIVEVAGQ